MNLSPAHTVSLLFAYNHGIISMDDLRGELSNNGFDELDIKDWLARQPLDLNAVYDPTQSIHK